MKVALVYNVKAEASPHTALTIGQEQISTNRTSLSPSFGLASSGVSHSHRVEVPEHAEDFYAEWDTMETVNAVKLALEERHDVAMVEANEHACQKLLEIRPDFAFNMSEGLYGISREAQIPALLEMLRIPYLGSDPLTVSLCLEKSRTKEILSYHGLRTAQFTVINSMEAIRESEVSFPAIVKPLHEGSSKGIYNSSVVRSTEELLEAVQLTMVRHGQPALVEDYLPGREFTVAVLGNGDKVRLLPIIELKFDALPAGANSIYSYEAKWIWDTVDNPLDIYECPAKLGSSLKEEIEILCRDAYRVLNCRDWARIDIRLDARGRPNILEINPLPGILPRKEDNSCFPKAARTAGMSYSELVNTVLDIALERCGIYATTNRPRAVEVV